MAVSNVRPIHELIPPEASSEALAQLDLEMLMSVSGPASARAMTEPVWQEDLTSAIYENLLREQPPETTLSFEDRLRHLALLMETARERSRSSGLPSQGATRVAAAVLAARREVSDGQTSD